ncbi:hypothetical protein EDD37DRAFT_617898 [Exophiala viscosa]|uniref:Uncharacterized protein n=1 Tax=Exophiala viscosa TaxID=2486360 RepID=A0AAN6E483_9EURO|nr:hypothetical protein EDD36DRAFT_471996 [Exophiala viscosa]KAI1629822.1 hypothetical protein EDD37DRAFT_617898 [Exophiala viscosa]
MGRKPHPLITEFYIRGAKVCDTSNRYDHTCRKCGEHVPKGRIENLQAHLTKHCTALNKFERVKILLRFHDLARPNVRPNIDPNYVEPDDLTAGTAPTPARAPAAATEEQDFDALNVLAEASRQVGHNAQAPFDFAALHTVRHDDFDPTGQDFAHTQAVPTQSDGHVAALVAAQDVVDPQLDAHFDNDEDFLAAPEMLAKNNVISTTMPPDFSQVFSYNPNEVSVTQDGLLSPNLVTTQSQALTAMSAGEAFDRTMMEMEIENGTPLDDLMSDTLPQGQAFHLSALFETQPVPRESTTSQTLVSTTSETIGSVPGFRPIAMNPNGQATQNMLRSKAVADPKVRGPMTNEKKEQSRATRKVGACMRCRMLRKPCGDTPDPCKLCASVQNPRYWKKCLRGSVKDKYPLYRVSAYRTTLFQETELMKRATINDKIDANIEAFHFDEYKVILTCREVKPKTRLFSPANAQDANLPFGDAGIVVIDAGIPNDNGPRVERYLKAITPAVIMRERSAIIKACLNYAVSLNVPPQVVVTAKDDKNPIPDVIDLWTVTALLTNPDWKENFVVVADGTDGTDGTEERTVIGADSSSYAYFMVSLQFRAMLEKRADALYRAVVGHFDKRVYDPLKVPGFDTLLAAIIFLNCAERMSWQFRVWENEQSRPFRWVCDESPDAYADKGEKLAEAVQLALSLRQLDPKLAIDTESGLLAVQNEEDDTLALFLATAQIPGDFATRHENAAFNQFDYRSLDGSLFRSLLEV